MNIQNIQRTHRTQHQKKEEKTKHPYFKMAEDLNKHLFKVDIHMKNRHMERCSA